MPRRSRKPIGLFKRGTKHSGTIVDNVGQGSNAVKLVILKTSGGPRSTDGGPMTIQSFSSTDDECKTGDTCKYVNLSLQVGPRQGLSEDDRTGWMEWAFLCVRENETEVPATNLGTQTLGDICTNMYRGECIMSGVVPVGSTQPAVATIKLKIPKLKQTIKLGDEWRYLTNFRSVSSTSTSTIALRVVKSWNLKVYS